jgi:hypothetical protein
VRYVQQVWLDREHYFRIDGSVRAIGYGHVGELNLQPLFSFVNNCENYSALLDCYELLQDFKQQTANILKVIKISQLVSAETLQHEHLQHLKRILKSPEHTLNLDFLFTKEGRSKVTCWQLYTSTNAMEI